MNISEHKKDGDVQNIIGTKLKQMREAKHFTQSKFCELCAVKGLLNSVATLSKIENQKRSVYDYEIKIFADVLDISIEAFYED